MVAAAKYEIIRRLQTEVRNLHKPKKLLLGDTASIGLGALEAAFPDDVFPTGAIHEFVSASPEGAAATSGFICGLLGQLMQRKGPCLWVSTKRTIFPPALKNFGIDPDRIIFIDLQRPRDVLWAIEEGLKCDALSVVTGELSELSFTESRRLQLAVETSCVTGLIHRYDPMRRNTTACITRWEIKPLPGMETDMPGLGMPRWDVHLLKVRNGKPGSWQFEWSDGGFKPITPQLFSISQTSKLKTG